MNSIWRQEEDMAVGGHTTAAPSAYHQHGFMDHSQHQRPETGVLDQCIAYTLLLVKGSKARQGKIDYHAS